MAENKASALILGHSFVRRVKQFIERDKQGLFVESLNISEKCRVYWQGPGCWTVQKLISYNMGTITSVGPEIIVLELGSNDICDPRYTPKLVAHSIKELVRRFHEEMQVQFIIVCQSTQREKLPYPSYNKNRHTLKELKYATFWHHRGVWNPSTNIFDRDGIHLNTIGHKALYKSFRGAILYSN
jgi:hypothetical protein